MAFRPLCSILLIAIVIDCAAAQETAIVGAIVDKDGHPLAGVLVYGSPGKCCPSTPEKMTSGNDGAFHLDHPGAVVHLSKDGFQPYSLVVKVPVKAQHIVLQPAYDSLRVPDCTRPGHGVKQIFWNRYGIRFNVPVNSVRISGGKPDVDYVVYVIKPKTGDDTLELWFGPYALSTLPDDDDFIRSAEFSQRSLVDSKGDAMGIDTRGRSGDGLLWRHTGVIGQGAVYRKASADSAVLFDRIVNSICFVAYPAH